MKTTEKVLGMIALGILFLVAGILGLIGIYLTAQSGLAYGIPIILILCGLLELYLAYDKHRSYATNPESRKRDEVGARDERTLMIRLKATNAASTGVLFAGIFFNSGIWDFSCRLSGRSLPRYSLAPENSFLSCCYTLDCSLCRSILHLPEDKLSGNLFLLQTK